MANYETTKIQPNEVVKADDFEFGFEAQIDNISRAFQGVFEPNQNFVIGGRITPYYQGGMNVSIAPIFGVCASTEKSFIDTNKIEPISISQAGNDLRIDIIQVRATVEDYDEQQRSFSDFETGVNELRYVFTRQRYKVETNVKIGIPGAVTAPTVDEGWVKLAEIVIPVGTTEITESNIKNITSDIAGLENSEWTNEKTSTYNMGYISDVNRRFREQHNEDGSHKENIIGERQLNIGTNSDQVSGNILPIGKQIPINGTSNTATTKISDIVSILATKITDLFNSYLKYGAFNFNGEIVIGNIIDNNKIVKPLKIGSSGDGTAYLNIDTKSILTITKGGLLRMSQGYSAVASTDLITKSVTDSISIELSALSDRVDNIVANLDSTIYANNVLSRFKFSSQSIDVATTANIQQLYGLFTVDSVALTVGMVVLVKDQTNKVENGIYTVSETSWTRTIPNTDKIKHKFFKVNSGTINKNKIFYTPLETFTVGESAISFSESILRTTNTPSTIPYRDTNGRIQTSTPVASNDAANKSYVDNYVNETKNIADEAVTTNKIEDESVTPQKIRGVLPTSKGGTGEITAQNACNAFINALATGSDTPVDDDYYVAQYANGGVVNTNYYRRPISKLWTYIQGKISSVLGLSSVHYNGNSQTTNAIKVYDLADGTDLDFVITPGQYKTDSGTVTNAPYDITDGFNLEVFYVKRTYVCQRLTRYVTTGITSVYVRTLMWTVENIWTGWSRLAYTDSTVANAENAINATNATKAISDENGNNIANTYAKKSELSNYDTVYVGSTAPSTSSSYKLWVQS